VISTYLKQIQLLVKRLLICYLVYFLSRLLFYFANITYFPSVGCFELVLDSFYGLRVDSFSIVISNSLFILLSLLPLNFYWNKIYQTSLFWIFVCTNSVFIAFNCIDAGYFPFIRKRSSADVLKQMGGQSDMGTLIPQFIKDFWWILLLYMLIIFLMIYLYRRIKIHPITKFTFTKPKQWLIIFLLFILCTGMAVIGARGGLQRVPITVVDAASVTQAEEAPIVLNSPFTIIKSFEETAVVDYDFYNENELNSIYNPIRHYKDSVFKKQNVVVLILESFGKEYTKLGRRSLTPFLDSLMDYSLVCDKAFSNGTKSIEGIPAILSSLPSLMENPFINSLYSLNKQSSFATLLGAEGYQTGFFHGGINGTMNFDSWASLAGYQAYYGKNEYNNNDDFDGFWGIWDEPFLQYSIKEMDTFKQPFHTAIFTLSSHHPYKVPEKYKNKFPKGYLENSESIGYADYALRQFFMSAQKTTWYANTLFVLTADHGSLSEDKFYSNVVGNQSIPVLFYKADNSLTKTHEAVFSQIDILPSVMSLLGYNKPFFSFGESFSEQQHGYDYLYSGSTHYSFGDSMLCIFNVPILKQTFNYKRDSILRHPTLNQFPKVDSLALLSFKAFIQVYNRTMIHNSGHLK
jgi:glucan phosphoethanolaminetransferase (alkaline phosphatase superfamily)